MATQSPFRIAIASGDGIGPEVVAEAVKVLEAVGQKYGHSFEFVEALVGGAAWEKYGVHLPPETIATCAGSDAILFGSVGGPVDAQHLPKWKDAERNAILGMRKHFNLAINIRPSKVYPELAYLSPLKADVIGSGVEIVIIRELVGGAYFGEHSTSADGRFARDDMTYTWEQVENALKFGIETARARGKRMTVVDKANVLETSRLWRKVAMEVAKSNPDVAVEFMYVDNAAMQLVTKPGAFDVIVTENLFGVSMGVQMGCHLLYCSAPLPQLTPHRSPSPLASLPLRLFCRISSPTRRQCCPAPWASCRAPP
jgi:3-isopropylmalate dehydrogenase